MGTWAAAVAAAVASPLVLAVLGYVVLQLRARWAAGRQDDKRAARLEDDSGEG